MLVQQLLETGARQWPDREALVCGEARLTYSQLDAAANRLAHALKAGGVGRGDRVAIILENSVEAVISIFGVLKAGGAFMMLHPGFKHDKLAYLLEDAEPSGLITDSARLKEVGDIPAAAPSIRCLVMADNAQVPGGGTVRSLAWSELASYSAYTPHCPCIDVDLATLIYTSGSTGKPKGVMSSHYNMVSVTSMVNGYLHNTADDVILNVLPLAFGYGLYQLFLAYQVGAKVVLDKGFAFPARTVALIEKEKVTALPGVPMLFALLLKYPDLLRRDLHHLRYMTNAASALPTAHLQQLRAALPQMQFISMYGQTECKRVCYLPPEELDHRPSSVGIPIPNTEVYIVDEENHRVGPGEVGELVVRGSHVMRGYWKAPELTAQKFRPGPLPGERVLYTGDLFKMDEDGYLYFVARKDDIIKSRGEKVSPREIENVICQLEGISESVVVGVPDPVLGQAVRLLVVLHDGAHLTERDIKAYCSRKLDDYMMPKYVEIVDDLPRNENGKVDKRRLMD